VVTIDHDAAVEIFVVNRSCNPKVPLIHLAFSGCRQRQQAR
jgi:hypothetical protein